MTELQKERIVTLAQINKDLKIENKKLKEDLKAEQNITEKSPARLEAKKVILSKQLMDCHECGQRVFTNQTHTIEDCTRYKTRMKNKTYFTRRSS